MYISTLKGNRTPEQEEAFSRLVGIEQLLVNEGLQQVTDKRSILSSSNLQETIIHTLTTYKYVLPAQDYTATIEDAHSHSYYLTSHGRISELVFSRLTISNEDETILNVSRSKGGYHQKPLFHIIRNKRIVKPDGWSLDTDDILGAIKTLEYYMINHIKNKDYNNHLSY